MTTSTARPVAPSADAAALADRRARARATLVDRALPTTEEEVWRYSRIGELDLARFTADDTDAIPVVPADLRDVIDGYGPRSGLVVIVDGHIAAIELEPIAVAAGVTAGPAMVDEASSGRGDDYFAVLNDAFCHEPLLIAVPPGTHLEHPIVVVDTVRADAALVATRLRLEVGADAQAAVLAVSRSAPDAGSLSVPFVDIAVADAARAGFYAVQDSGDRMWQIGDIGADVGSSAHLITATAAFGGEYSRVTTSCRLVGRGASSELFAVYFADGDQTFDFRTFQHHHGPDTSSDLLFKGVVDDRARSIYTGLIKVHPDAPRTNAFQTNRTIKLGSESWAESVPNLEIENNDVHCSHASTVGPIDDDQRFYLESRGVPPGVAERLVVTGFFAEVLGRIPLPGLAGPLADRVAAKLSDRVNR